MKSVVFAVFASLSLACLSLGYASPALAEDKSAQEKQLFEGDTAAGAKLSGTCVACHGSDGNSSNPQWPNIAGQHAAYTFAQLKAFKSGERPNPIMAGIVADLSEQDMRNLAVYYAGQKPKPGVADESLVEKGAAIYRGGIAHDSVPACAGCHGPAGRGNPTAVYPLLYGQHSVYLENQLKAYRSGERDESRNAKIMAAAVADLSDADLKAVASYISGLYPRGVK